MVTEQTSTLIKVQYFFGMMVLVIGLIMVLVAILSVLRFLFVRFRLYNYLAKNRPASWGKIQYGVGLTGIHNSAYFYSNYLENEEDNDDPEIFRMKKKIKDDVKRFGWMVIGITLCVVVVFLFDFLAFAIFRK